MLKRVRKVKPVWIRRDKLGTYIVGRLQKEVLERSDDYYIQMCAQELERITDFRLPVDSKPAKVNITIDPISVRDNTFNLFLEFSKHYQNGPYVQLLHSVEVTYGRYYENLLSLDRNKFETLLGYKISDFSLKISVMPKIELVK